MELDVILNGHWNVERVIVFQTVILQCVCLVRDARNICERITSCLDLCNEGAYDELLQDSYSTTAFF